MTNKPEPAVTRIKSAVDELVDLVQELADSASGEGCSEDLIVVDRKALIALCKGFGGHVAFDFDP